MQFVNPGVVPRVDNESIMSYHLNNGLVSHPEMLMEVTRLFPMQTPFASFLASKGLGKSLNSTNAGPTSLNYRIVGNRKVMWSFEGIDKKKSIIKESEYANTSAPGYGGEVITLYLDNNILSPYDVFALADNRTLLEVVDDMLPQETETGKWRYYCRLIRSKDTEYITDPTLLQEGEEVVWRYNSYYEGSETAYEHYQFNEWVVNYMNIMRFKFSRTGTAGAMRTSKHWVQGDNGEFAWIDHADRIMMSNMMKAIEWLIIDGKSTVYEDKILLRDLKGRDIEAGDGLLNMGDGSLRFRCHKLTNKFIDNVLGNMVIRGGDNGRKEVAVVGAKHFMIEWQYLMNEIGAKVFSDKIIEGEGSKKGVNMTFSFYEFNGVRFYPVQSDAMTDPGSVATNRKTHKGTPKSGHRAIFVSLGKNDSGYNDVELLALGDRSYLRTEIGGIDQGAKGVTSVDATHTHTLCEIGIKNSNPYGVAEIYYP
jgi:hypothetical protein